MRHSIMTEKIARRGARVPVEYTADWLDHALVRDFCSRAIVSFASEDPVARVLEQLRTLGSSATHQGFPVLDGLGALVGVVTRRDLVAVGEAGSHLRVGDLLRRSPAVIFEDSSLREAVDRMAVEGVGRLPVVAKDRPARLLGIVTRSDVLAAYAKRLDATHRREKTFAWWG
jgi:CBS domain-containing protein